MLLKTWADWDGGRCMSIKASNNAPWCSNTFDTQGNSADYYVFGFLGYGSGRERQCAPSKIPTKTFPTSAIRWPDR